MGHPFVVFVSVQQSHSGRELRTHLVHFLLGDLSDEGSVLLMFHACNHHVVSIWGQVPRASPHFEKDIDTVL